MEQEQEVGGFRIGLDEGRKVANFVRSSQLAGVAKDRTESLGRPLLSQSFVLFHPSPRWGSSIPSLLHQDIIPVREMGNPVVNRSVSHHHHSLGIPSCPGSCGDSSEIADSQLCKRLVLINFYWHQLGVTAGAKDPFFWFSLEGGGGGVAKTTSVICIKCFITQHVINTCGCTAVNPTSNKTEGELLNRSTFIALDWVRQAAATALTHVHNKHVNFTQTGQRAAFLLWGSALTITPCCHIYVTYIWPVVPKPNWFHSIWLADYVEVVTNSL